MVDLTDEELGDIYTFAVQLGKDAGNMLLEAARSRFGGVTEAGIAVEEKENSVDIVTQTDEGKLPNLGRMG